MADWPAKKMSGEMPWKSMPLLEHKGKKIG